MDRMMIRLSLSFFVFLYTALLSVVAMAQALPQLPGSIDPTRIEKQFEERPAPQSQSEPLIPDFEDEQPPRNVSDDIRFTLTSVQFEGASIYSEQSFLPYYEEYLGQDISLTTIYEIADAITDKYRAEGYVLTRVFPPPQRVRSGVITLKVVEGYIDKIEIEGAEVEHGGLIWRYLGPVWDARPFNVSLLETAMLRINDLSGVSGTSIMIPSFDTPGTSDLIVQLKKIDQSATLTVNNRGTDFVGPYQASGNIAFHGVLSEFDKLSVNVAATSQIKELNYIQTAFTMPLDTEGTRFNSSISYNQSEPGAALSFLDLQTKGLSASTSLSHSWVRSREYNLKTTYGLSFSDGETFIRGVKTSDSRSISANAAVSFDFADQYGGANLIRVTATQAVDAFGSTAEPSTSIRLDLDRIQVITAELSLKASAALHYSRSDQASSLQFGYGGTTFGRAYDSSEITGDQGFASKVTLTYTPKIESEIVKGFQAFTYYDFGAVWLGNDFNSDQRESGASAGFGVRVFLPEQIASELEMAKPLTRPVASEGNSDDPRVFFNLSKRF